MQGEAAAPPGRLHPSLGLAAPDREQEPGLTASPGQGAEAKTVSPLSCGWGFARGPQVWGVWRGGVGFGVGGSPA